MFISNIINKCIFIFFLFIFDSNCTISSFNFELNKYNAAVFYDISLPESKSVLENLYKKHIDKDYISKNTITDSLNTMIDFFVKNNIKNSLIEFAIRMNPSISKYFESEEIKTGSKKTFKEKLNMFKEIENEFSKEIADEDELERIKKRKDRPDRVKVKGVIIKVPQSWIDKDFCNFKEFSDYVKGLIRGLGFDRVFVKEEDKEDLIKKLCSEHKTLEPNEIMDYIVQLIKLGSNMKQTGNKIYFK
jgi:hypothetical protein